MKQRLQGRAVTPRRRSPRDIDAIVIHTPEGGVPGTLDVLNETRASFDVYLPLGGTFYKCNDWWNYIAWQAGDWHYNQRSVGIEQGDYARNSGNFSQAHYRRLARVVTYLLQTTATPFRRATEYGQPGIIAHATITPNQRTDPGSDFKWDLLMDLIKNLQGDEKDPVWLPGSLTAVQGAVARFRPTRRARPLHNLEKGRTYSTDGYTNAGMAVAGSSRWYHLSRESGYGWVHASGGQYRDEN